MGVVIPIRKGEMAWEVSCSHGEDNTIFSREALVCAYDQAADAIQQKEELKKLGNSWPINEAI